MPVTNPLDGMSAQDIRTAAGLSQGNIRNIVLTAANAGSALGAGLIGQVQSPVSGTIVGVALLADQVGSAVVDIWKTTYASAPPSSSNSITASAQPNLSSTQKYTDTTLTGWNTAVAVGDVFAFNLNSASTIKLLTVELTIQTT